MKNSILFIILIVSIAFTGHTQITNADISKQFSFSNDNFDFGKIPFGKPAEYTIEIVTNGNTRDELEIEF